MGRLAFIFPGQGTQYVGMGKTLYEQFPVAKNTFEEACDVLGFDLKKLCFEGSLLKLSNSAIAQLAIVTVSVSAYRIFLQELGIVPDFAAGHSLGEYAALIASGAITFQDGIKLLQQRGACSQVYCDSGEGSMSIIDQIPVADVEAACQTISKGDIRASVACYNAPNQTVITGNSDAVMAVEDLIADRGGQITPLLMSGPFHSPYMRPAADQFSDSLNNCPFSDFSFPVMSNVTALPYESPSDIPRSLYLHMTHPVRWVEILSYFEREGVEILIEMGPQQILSNLSKLNDRSFEVHAFGKANELAPLYALRSPVSASPTKLLPEVTLAARCLAIAAATRNRNMDLSSYEAEVVEPYRQLQQLNQAMSLLDGGSSSPSAEQKELALKLLALILAGKKAPASEVEVRYKQLAPYDV